MKRFLKILKWIGIILGIIIIAFVIAVYAMYPPKMDAPLPDIKASTDSAVIAHGKYLVYAAAHCAECHVSDRKLLKENLDNWMSLPVSGGMDFAFPGAVVYSKNLTSDKETGTGRYSDAELARIVRYGVRPDRTELIPFMNFANMSDEDLTAIISYLRTIPPVHHEIPATQLNFMMKAVAVFVMKPFPPKGEIPKSVKRDTTFVYGEYLAKSISGCEDCHTKSDEMSGKLIGPSFAGGGKTPSAMEEEGVWVITPNLTPDPETGRIYNWSQQQFIDRFHKGRMINESIMPWEAFKNYNDDDLKALYKFLKNLPPVKNDIGEEIIREKS